MLSYDFLRYSKLSAPSLHVVHGAFYRPASIFVVYSLAVLFMRMCALSGLRSFIFYCEALFSGCPIIVRICLRLRGDILCLCPYMSAPGDIYW